MRHAVVDRLERPAAEEVRRVNGVPGRAELLGEAADGIGRPERVMEEDDLGDGGQGRSEGA